MSPLTASHSPGAVGRLRSAAAGVAARVDSEQVGQLAREVLRFAPDVLAMLRGVLADPRVPSSAKVQAGAIVAYLVSPLNAATEWIPVVGQLDDAALVALATQRLLVGAGEPLLREHWRGSEPAFQLLLKLSAALALPGGRLRAAGLAAGLWSAVHRAGSRKRPGTGKVVDGEVVRPADPR